jgi:antirestriction factor ArdC-like protein
MTKQEIQAEALDRARTGQTISNYPAIFAGFMAKGIAETEIKPRENIFTFNAWKALGRSVKKGEHGVKVVTFITCGGKVDIDETTGGETKTAEYRRPHTTAVFHISQTELTADRDARLAARRGERPDYRTNPPAPHFPRRSAWASGHGRYPSIDPGERMADDWAAQHCPSDNR